MADANGRGRGRRVERAAGRGRRADAEHEALDERRYYRIGEVSRLTGVKAHVLRYWETEFRWMAPAKSRSQQRLYRKRDIEVIRLIRRLLYEERYTIAGARRRLRELGVARALEGAAAGARVASEAAEPEAGAAPEAAALRDPPAAPALRDALRRIREELLAIRAAL